MVFNAPGLTEYKHSESHSGLAFSILLGAGLWFWATARWRANCNVSGAGAMLGVL